MHLNLRKENFNLALAIGVAAQSGWDFQISGQDDKGIDVTLLKNVDYIDAHGQDSTMALSLAFQLKCTESPEGDKRENTSFSFEDEQFQSYKRTRGRNWGVALMVVPKENTEWLQPQYQESAEDEESPLHGDTLLKHCCYAKVLAFEGQPSRNILNEISGKTLRFHKRENLFGNKFLEEFERNEASKIEMAIEQEIKIQLAEKNS